MKKPVVTKSQMKEMVRRSNQDQREVFESASRRNDDRPNLKRFFFPNVEGKKVFFANSIDEANEKRLKNTTK